MGLAATQARYLGLTARKTNIEYEGQQVNQQRTVLANESANIYQELYSLNIPTPPSVTDYYTTEYSYSAGGKTYTMNSFSKNSDGTYTVNVTYSDFQEVAQKAFGTGGIVQNGDGTYTIKMATSSNSYILDPVNVRKNDAIDKQRGLTPGTGQYCAYTDSETGLEYYIGQDWLQQQTYPVVSQTIERYFTNEEITDITENRNNCQIIYNQEGRITSIVDPKITNTPLSMTTTSKEDTQGYENAMNMYNTEYAQYQRELEAINAKTAEIQQQDRSLELRLRQLDTEQSSLQTEMDALKSVLDKNLERVFNTFS